MEYCKKEYFDERLSKIESMLIDLENENLELRRQNEELKQQIELLEFFRLLNMLRLIIR